MTGEVYLSGIDFGEEGEEEDARMLCDSGVENLKRVIGA